MKGARPGGSLGCRAPHKISGEGMEVGCISVQLQLCSRCGALTKQLRMSVRVQMWRLSLVVGKSSNQGLREQRKRTSRVRQVSPWIRGATQIDLPRIPKIFVGHIGRRSGREKPGHAHSTDHQLSGVSDHSGVVRMCSQLEQMTSPSCVFCLFVVGTSRFHTILKVVTDKKGT